MDINLKIDSQKSKRVENALAGLFPIPEINKGKGKEPDMQPEFTKEEWVKQCINNYVINSVKRWEESEAKKAINVVADKSLLTIK